MTLVLVVDGFVRHDTSNIKFMMVNKVVKYTMLFLVLMIMATTGSAQKLTIKLADKAFHDFSWMEAIDLYTYVHEKDPNNVYVIRKLADCYRNITQWEEVEKWLELIIEMGEENPEDLFYYSMALKSNGKYHDAEVILKDYKLLKPDDDRVALQQSLLEYVRFLIQDSSRFVVNIAPFNSRGADWGPTFYEDKIVFVSTGNPEDSRDPKYNWDQLPFLDIYAVTRLDDGGYSDPKVYAKDLNSTFHDGPATFDIQNNRMYFNSNRSTKNASRAEEENNLQIYYADLEKGDWVFKGSFEHNNVRDNYRHPSVSSDGLKLFFSSDRPGGKGGNDIWYCDNVNGSWTEPINFEVVNTEGHEVFPYYSPEGILYFASDGMAGMGDLDLFMAISYDGGKNYTRIENMGYPINSPQADFGMVLDDVGMKGFFSSDRPGGLGHDDIYEVEILYIPVQISGTITDKMNTFEVEGAMVCLLDEKLDTLETLFTREDGSFVFSKTYKQRDYTIAVSSEGYLPAKRTVSTYGKLPYEKIVENIFIDMDIKAIDEPEMLEPLSMEMVGGNEIQIIQIEHINYGFDSDKILPEAATILDKIINLVSGTNGLKVMVESHTDSKGSDDYNLRLSERRAKSAYTYLLEHGIDSDMIEYTGYGETQLLNHCEDGVECMEEEHAINRRSIIKVIREGKYKSKKNNRSLFFF